MELSAVELEALCSRAANTAVALYADSHPCLTERQRAMVVAQDQALVEEGGNNGTLRVLIQWGVNMTNITKQVRNVILWLLGLIALGVFIDWKFIK